MKVTIRTSANTVPFEYDKFHTLTYILDLDNRAVETYFDGELLLSGSGFSSALKISDGFSISLPALNSGVVPYIKAYIKSMSIDKYIPESE